LFQKRNFFTVDNKTRSVRWSKGRKSIKWIDLKRKREKKKKWEVKLI
jgi:hypothetical protein